MKRRLVLKKPLLQTISTRFWHLVGALVNRVIISYEVYKRRNSAKYNEIYSRLPPNLVDKRNEYVDIGGLEYKTVDMKIENKEMVSQYYIYKHIIEKDPQAIVCNIGAYYCAADYHYVMKNKKSEVHALDFGNMAILNKGLECDRLHLYSGYPLEILEEIKSKRSPIIFDYTIFTRTAVLLNKNEFNSYMEVISKVSKKIVFFEVIDISNIVNTTLDLNAIPIDSPIKMYSGMYIHNYSKILEKYGYIIAHNALVPPGSFPNESADGHHMICIVGERLHLQ